MAVLGPQLVLTMIAATFVSKLSLIYSFAQWYFSRGLVHHVMPSDSELKKLAGVPSAKGTKNRGKQDKNNSDSFSISKSTEFPLHAVPVNAITLFRAHFYFELRWLVDFSLASTLVYAVTELYLSVTSSPPGPNLSLLWCTVAAMLAIKALGSLTALYFRADAEGERAMCLSFGVVFFLLAMGAMLLDGEHLELGIETSYVNFSETATEFFRSQNLTSAPPKSAMGFKLSVAALGGLLGALLTFPGLRYARAHHASLQQAAGRPLLQLVLHADFGLPLLAAALWLRPLVRATLTQQGPRWLRMQSEDVDSLQIYILLLVCVLRMGLTKVRLQAHLDMPQEQCVRMRSEPGRIQVNDLRRGLSAPRLYMNAASLQYLAPVVFLMFCTLMLKTVSGRTWTGHFQVPGLTYDLEPVAESRGVFQELLAGDTLKHYESLVAHLGALRALQPLVAALLAFCCWWTNLALLLSSSFGLLHYAYLS